MKYYGNALQSEITRHDLELAEGLLGEKLKRILLIIRFPRDELLVRKKF